MTTQKTAVDATAEEYWSSYFGDYGKAWVRKIPHRVASALLQRTAKLEPSQALEQAKAAHVFPLGNEPVFDGPSVHVEGVSLFPRPGQPLRRLFRATFDASTGALQSLESREG